MKIAVWHNLPSGGGKRALYNHIVALKDKGHYLEVWTTDYSSADYLPLSGIVVEHRKPITVTLQKLNKIKSPVKKALKTIELLKNHCKECIKEIEDKNFDVIFANSCSITYMPFIGLFSKIPTVVFLGEPNRLLYEASENRNIWELPAYRFSLKAINRFRRDLMWSYLRRFQLTEEIRAAKSYTRVLVNSQFSRESIKRAYGIDSAICYLGVDEKLFHLEEDLHKSPYVIGMGRISRAKNVDTAIRVIAKIPGGLRPQLKWISNGFDPEYFELVNNLANDLNVDFIPLVNINDDRLKETLGKAAVMIYTSHLEPFGLAPIEANMCGTAVVAIAEGGVRESIQSHVNGILVDGNNLEELANLLIKFLDNISYASQMGLQARLHALKHWNWSRMAENIEREILAVIR